MTDLQKTASGSFSADFDVANAPYAKAELLKAMREFVLAIRNIDGGTVFRLPGTTPVSATGFADFSGWTDAGFAFDSEHDAPFPFHDEQHPAPPVNPDGDTDPIA